MPIRQMMIIGCSLLDNYGIIKITLRNHFVPCATQISSTHEDIQKCTWSKDVAFTHTRKKREECRCRLTQDQFWTCMNLSNLLLRSAPFLPDISTLCLGVPFIPYSSHTNTRTQTLRALMSVQYIVFSSSCEPRKRLWENAREVPCRKSPMLGVCVRLCVCLRRASYYGWMGRMGLELSRGGAQVAHNLRVPHTYHEVGGCPSAWHRVGSPSLTAPVQRHAAFYTHACTQTHRQSCHWWPLHAGINRRTHTHTEFF